MNYYFEYILLTDLGWGQNIFMAFETRILYERDNAHNCEKF